MSDSIPASGPLPRPQESGSSGDKGHGIAPIVLDSESDWQSDWDSDSDTDGDMDVEMADATGQKGEGHEADEGDEVDAPFYNVPARPLGAVEAPALISDVDRGMKAFGNVYSYDQVNLHRSRFTNMMKGNTHVKCSSWTRTETQSPSI